MASHRESPDVGITGWVPPVGTPAGRVGACVYLAMKAGDSLSHLGDRPSAP